MSDTPAYMIANFVVHDKDEYRKYEKGFFPILKRHGGEFFTYDDNTVTFEGADPREGRVVMFKGRSSISRCSSRSSPCLAPGPQTTR